jgi:hypothetical protein
MKIIEGTPEEIKKYLNKDELLEQAPVPTKKGLPSIRHSTTKSLFGERIKETVHWSSTKHQWVAIKDMDASYILNTVKKMLRSNPSNEWLLSEDEFKALIINLADKIEESEPSNF